MTTHIPFHWPFDQSKYKAVTRDGREVNGLYKPRKRSMLFNDNASIAWMLDGRHWYDAISDLDLHLEPISDEEGEDA